ncbi:hypothetical protein DID88_004895 [Monilinia fructigena]|uniref:Uncharacterized protein n=1 Tax=Monilinia fructigena TaxID=38457 RepID=A0A395IVF7_9HELO|nr:hypothetical protein DID88_004895 [Monilinia fructigena]
MSPGKHNTDDHSVVIIGAGWQGIAAARTYLQLKPNVKLTVIDSDSSVGGVWSVERSYPGLIADSPVGCYEFSDMCMDEDPELKMWNIVPGDKVGQYLRNFTKKFHIDEHLRLNTKVLSAVPEHGIGEGSRWSLEVQENGKEKETVKCDKLIVASGPSSDPRMPNLDTSRFHGPVFHSLYLGARHAELTSDNIKHVTVVGGNKSAAEVVNLCASAGKKVTWLIREGGAGPGMFIQAKSGSVHNAAIAFSRWAVDFFWPGLWLVGKYWKWASHYMLKDLYDQSENARKIAPDMQHLFWSTSAPSFLQQESKLFEKLNAGILIDVQRTHISKVHNHSVTLDNGMHLATDALIFATGWNLTFSKFFTPETRIELDLPIPLGTEPPVMKAYWKELDTEADKWNPPDNTPYHLYRQSIPTALATSNDRSLIIFLGVLASPQIPTYAELSALWGIAYLENMHSPEVNKVFSDKLTMDKQTARTNSFMKWRYRRAGIIEPNVGAEVQDLL